MNKWINKKNGWIGEWIQKSAEAGANRRLNEWINWILECHESMNQMN